MKKVFGHIYDFVVHIRALNIVSFHTIMHYSIVLSHAMFYYMICIHICGFCIYRAIFYILHYDIDDDAYITAYNMNSVYMILYFKRYSISYHVMLGFISTYPAKSFHAM